MINGTVNSVTAVFSEYLQKKNKRQDLFCSLFCAYSVLITSRTESFTLETSFYKTKTDWASVLQLK